MQSGYQIHGRLGRQQGGGQGAQGGRASCEGSQSCLGHEAHRHLYAMVGSLQLSGSAR